jgi:hypothetical protein
MSESTEWKDTDWNAKARRLYPRACWVSGDGPYAVLAYCRQLSIELIETLERAQARKEFIDGGGCCGRCCRAHEIVDLRDFKRGGVQRTVFYNRPSHSRGV